MGFKRVKPEKLAQKLLSIRKKLDYSLTEMAKALSSKDITLLKQNISLYEKGEREPNLIILLRYARMAGTTMETLVDDKLDLET